jgi:hypothetical protein
MSDNATGVMTGIFVLLFVFVLFWPWVRILRRLGLNPGWLLLVFIPLFGALGGWWALAYAKWPALAELEREKKEKGLTVLPQWGK